MGRGTALIAGVVTIAVIVIVAFYFIDQTQKKTEEVLEKHQERVEQAEAWVKEFTDEDADYIHLERDTSLVVIKAGKEIYKVKYDLDKEEVDYVIFKEEIIYDKE